VVITWSCSRMNSSEGGLGDSANGGLHGAAPPVNTSCADGPAAPVMRARDKPGGGPVRFVACGLTLGALELPSRMWSQRRRDSRVTSPMSFAGGIALHGEDFWFFLSGVHNYFQTLIVLLMVVGVFRGRAQEAFTAGCRAN